MTPCSYQLLRGLALDPYLARDLDRDFRWTVGDWLKETS